MESAAELWSAYFSSLTHARDPGKSVCQLSHRTGALRRQRVKPRASSRKNVQLETLGQCDIAVVTQEPIGVRAPIRWGPPVPPGGCRVPTGPPGAAVGAQGGPYLSRTPIRHSRVIPQLHRQLHDQRQGSTRSSL